MKLGINDLGVVKICWFYLYIPSFVYQYKTKMTFIDKYLRSW